MSSKLPRPNHIITQCLSTSSREQEWRKHHHPALPVETPTFVNNSIGVPRPENRIKLENEVCGYYFDQQDHQLTEAGQTRCDLMTNGDRLVSYT
jgi:hypothetical protein